MMAEAQVFSARSKMDKTLYEKDFYAWTQKQSALISQGQWADLDVSNLIEEIESLGRQQRSELRNRLSVLLAHLLKGEYQPEKRSRSWRNTIRIQRLDIADLMADSPSLQPYLPEAISRAYAKAAIAAADETGLTESTFPAEANYTAPQILDNSFFPGA